MTKNRLTIYDIAKLVGCSPSSVSNAINGRENVGAELKRKISEVVKHTGFVRNSAAQGLISGRTFQLGFLVNTLISTYLLELLHQLTDKALKHSYFLTIIEMGWTDFATRKKIYSQKNMDGFIVYPAWRDYFKDIAFFQEHGIPFVLIDECFSADDVSVVHQDHYLNSGEAVRRFVENGHRRIGYFGWHGDDLSSMNKLNGFRDAIHELDVPYDSDCVLTWNSSFQCPTEGIDRLLSRRPTAVYVASGIHLLELWNRLRNNGTRIPEDISIIANDYLLEYEYLEKRPSHFRMPAGAMAEDAVSLLLKLIEDSASKPECRVHKSLFVSGDTVGNAPGTGKT